MRCSPRRVAAAVLATAALLAACTPDRQHQSDAGGSTVTSLAPPTPAPAAPAAAPAPAGDAGSAEAFWTQFRAAALSGDSAQLLALVHFPFSTRGEMDDDPVLPHGREAFPRLFAQLLAQDSGRDGSYLQTEEQLLRETVTLPAQEVELAQRGSFRVGAFVFRRVDGAWRLAHAYTAN